MLNHQPIKTGKQTISIIAKSEVLKLSGSWHFDHGVAEKYDLTRELINYNFLACIDDINHLIHPEDTRYIQEFFRNSPPAEPLEFSFRLISPSGEIKQILGKGNFINIYDRHSDSSLSDTNNIAESEQAMGKQALKKSKEPFQSVPDSMTNEDKTEEKTADAELKAKNELLEGVLNAPNLGLMICKAIRDRSKQIIDFEHILGSKRTEALANKSNLVGQRMFDLFPGAKGQLEDLRKVVETGVTNSYEYHYQHKEVDCWFLISNSKYADGIVHVWEDITAQKKSEEQTRQNQMLAELNQAKTDFFSNVSHEFRTPLTLILGPLEDLLTNVQSNVLKEDNLSMLKMVHRNALRLKKLVNSLLDFSCIEAGRMDAIYQPTDLAEYTTLLAGNFRSAIEKAGLKLVVKCDSTEPVYVNRDMWEKIVLNLLSNAFKFTFEGKIEVSLIDYKKQVQLHVRDTGIGISGQNVSKLFERFVRIESKSRTSEGSGIGLAMVNELVKTHKGSIKVKSKEGEGTLFVVSIPKGKAHLPPKNIYEFKETGKLTSLPAVYAEEAMGWLLLESENTPENIKKHTVNISNRYFDSSAINPKPVVLLADDDYDMREYIRSVLNGHYTVVAVNNGKKAWEMISDGLIPDLLLVDVMMPELDGNSLLKKIKSNEATSKIPFILLSARVSEQERVEGLTNGADDYVGKPFSRRELLARIDARLQISAIQKQTEQQLKLLNNQLEQRILHRTKELEDGKNVIEKQKALIQRILNAIPQMICVFDSSGKVNFLNERWYSYTGLGEEELSNLRIQEYDVFQPEQKFEIHKRWNQSIEDRIPCFGKSLIKDKSGNYRWHLDVLVPVKNELNEIEMWIGTFTDAHDQLGNEKHSI
jgi:PAS domain S-box-containing protein